MNCCVVLNYNDWEETRRFCDYITKYEAVDYVIIVDNKSTDNSVEQLSKYQNSKVILICAENNNGYASGNNFGIKYLINRFDECNVIISNPDIDIEESDLNKILGHLEREEIGVSTGVIYTNGRIVSNFGWNLPTYWGLIANNFFITYKILRILKKSIYISEEQLHTSDLIYCDCVPGCFFCMRLDTLKNIDLLDERTFLFGEENILGSKVKRRGYKVCIDTQSKVIHYGGHSIKKSRKKKKTIRKYAENSLELYVNDYLKADKMKVILFRIIFKIAMIEQDIVTSILHFLKHMKG